MSSDYRPLFDPEENRRILAEYEAQFASAWDKIVARTSFAPDAPDRFTPIATGFGGTLILHTAGENIAVLTEDGGPAITGEWHTGPETGESLYVEVWTGPSQRPFHGYIDPTSRKVVQTG